MALALSIWGCRNSRFSSLYRIQGPFGSSAPSPHTLLPMLHWRGKKKNAKARTSIAVRLKEDMPGFGREGAIVPVPIGQMRNSLYPRRAADYVNVMELKRNRTPVERDIAFGRQIESVQEVDHGESFQGGLSTAEETPRIDLNTLPPQGAFNLLSDIVPPTLDFHRAPITSSGTQRTREQEPKSQEEEAWVVAPPPDVSPRQVADNIYGSVSTSDIGTAIKALIHDKGFSGLVVLPDEDIQFANIANTGQKADKIKKLGEFEYTISIKGYEEAIKRRIRILSTEASDNATRAIPETGPGSFVSMDLLPFHRGHARNI